MPQLLILNAAWLCNTKKGRRGEMRYPYLDERFKCKLRQRKMMQFIYLFASEFYEFYYWLIKNYDIKKGIQNDILDKIKNL